MSKTFADVLDSVAEDVHTWLGKGMPPAEVKEYVRDLWMGVVEPNLRITCAGTADDPDEWIMSARNQIENRIELTLEQIDGQATVGV